MLFLLLENLAVQAQYGAAPQQWRDRIYYGGNVGASFGTLTSVQLAPIVGYRFTTKLSAGLGYTFIYLNDKSSNFSMTVNGGNIFSRYFVYDNIFLHTSLEELFYNVPPGFTLDGKTNFAQTNVYVGGGYRQPIGDRGAFLIMLLYNINQSASSFSLYSNPQITVGFGFGF